MKRALKLVALAAWTLLAFGVGVEYASITPRQAYANGYTHGVKVCLEQKR